VRVSAKAEYAVRAAIELAAGSPGIPVKKSQIVTAQKIPAKFLENILIELRHAGLIQSQRPEELRYVGTAEPLREAWVALRGSIREVLESVSLVDLVAGDLPSEIGDITKPPEAWVSQ